MKRVFVFASLLIIMMLIVVVFGEIVPGIPMDINSYDSWRFDYIDMNEVWTQLGKIDYSDILVAVIDTGIYVDHTDLNISEKGYDFYHKDNDPSDHNGHGTHVAGIIGAKANTGYDNVVGIAPGVEILPIKVYSDSGYISSYAVSKGIIYAVDNNADIINLSLYVGSGLSHIEEALEYAEEHGVLVIASTGNSSNLWEDDEEYNQKYLGYDRFSKVMYAPAAYKTVLSVGAVMKNPYEDRVGVSDFSHISGLVNGEFSQIDVVAPGSYIKSSSHISLTSSRVMSGTSMAAPHVSGLAVLLIAKHPDLSLDKIREIIAESSGYIDVDIPSQYNKTDVIGGGLININQAVNFSPLREMEVSSDSKFDFDPVRLNYLVHVDQNTTELDISGTLMSGTRIWDENGEYTSLSEIKLEMYDEISVFEFNVEWEGIERTYKIFAQYDRPGIESCIHRVTVEAGGVTPSVTEKNKDYYVTVPTSTSSVNVIVETYDSEDLVAFVLDADPSNDDYSNIKTTPVVLTDKTTLLGIKVKSASTGEEASHMMAIIKENADSILSYDTDPIIITNKVSLELDTEAVVLDYGIDADPNYSFYDFNATVVGADRKDIVWSLDDDRYVQVDSNGLVSVKEDAPDGLGDFSVVLKAQSVVGGAVDYADILFVEKTPLGQVNFFAPYISGYSDGTFRPLNSISRAEVATIFAKILNLQTTLDQPAFDDVLDSHWAYPYVQAIYEAGIFSGYNDGTFLPDAPISRAEIAQVFTNYWNYSDIEVNASHVIDIPDVSDDYWAADAIHKLYNTRIFTGYLNNAFRPIDNTLREELVYMVNKLIGRNPIEVEEPQFTDVPLDYFYNGDIEAASQFYVEKNNLEDLME